MVVLVEIVVIIFRILAQFTWGWWEDSNKFEGMLLHYFHSGLYSVI